ncbi:acylneuraminate cytidylyltransferase [candidate division WS5 bacterium]|uniref:Acylneuraminate cytidylyltransferase n=1 Tax=candidate division WS5 bacterium TaxID=2093353 RepID=A0A419DFG0_9BACT|nr:MAG: acylneuraminate cytidylyltransferase [candidate division WS5 bacterium]
MVGAIVQARMTSTRLPGKVLRMIKERPVIDYLFERLLHCKRLDTAVLATTTNQQDDLLEEYAVRMNLQCFRGSEEDVLDRFWGAARTFNIEHIVRITADCPLIDPKICDRVIETYLIETPDYVVTGPRFAEGLDCEIFSLNALETSHKNAIKKSEREHVTLYINNHPELFRTIIIENETDDSQYRFTVDEPQDYDVVTHIIDALYRDGHFPFNAGEIKHYLDLHPEIVSLNSGITRNEGLILSLEKDKKDR